MATFKIVLDTRTTKKGDKYNLAVRMVKGNDVMYMNITKMTRQQYKHVFIDIAKDENSIEFRETCNAYITKCERILSELNPFSKQRLRELFYDKDKQIPHSLLLKELFQYFILNYEDLKLKTRDHFRTTMNVLETFKKGISVGDITPEFLNKFEKKKKLSEGCSQSTIDSYSRDLRRIINYFSTEIKLIPKTYQYPFGKGGYSIKSFFPKKLVLKNIEIKAVAEFRDFDNPNQEYARDIWLFLYRCNGINFGDLLRLRWDNIKGDYFIFFRKKTETTRKNNIKEIIVPINSNLKELIEKVGVKESPYIIGKMNDQYEENTFNNKSHKLRQIINRDLTTLSEKLNLSVPLKLKTARDCFATTLKRAGESKDVIGEMLGHSNSIVTEHYLASLDAEKTFKVNEALF
jgi:integrase